MDMTRVKDLTGKSFGQWTVLRFSHAQGNVAYWLCQCDCPEKTERAVFGGDLKRGMSTGCGCQRIAKMVAKVRKHDMSGKPAYLSWQHMKQRCQNPDSDGYYLYGGRGITVCERWQDFQNFWEDMGPTWRRGTSIDRYPDKNGNYEPTNCRWATPAQQASNRRTERIIDTPKGRMSVTQASDVFDIPRQTIFARLRYEWTDPAELVKQPKAHRPRGSKKGGRL